MTTELKQCPRCGGEGQKGYGIFGYKVVCAQCGNATQWHNSMLEAIDAWNFQTADKRFRHILERASVYA